MRFWAFIFMIAASPVAAQMTPTERFEDRVHVRMPAALYELWRGAACQLDNTCSSSIYRAEPSNVVFHCLSEGYSVCEAAGRSDREKRYSCVSEIDGLVAKITAEIDVSDLSARLQTLADQASGWKKRPYLRGIATLEMLGTDCEGFRTANVHGLPPDAFCDRVQRMYVASALRELQHLVSLAEQDR